MLLRDPGAALAAEAIYLVFLFQADKTEVIAVIPQPELLPAVDTVDLLTQSLICGRVKVKAAHTVNSV